MAEGETLWSHYGLSAIPGPAVFAGAAGMGTGQAPCSAAGFRVAKFGSDRICGLLQLLLGQTLPACQVGI